MSGWFHVCPQDVPNRAVAIRHLQVTDAGDDDISGAVNDQIFALGCEGQALVKPILQHKVWPHSGGDFDESGCPSEGRKYGINRYMAAVKAKQAWFDGAARTVLGTEHYIKDVSDHPCAPLFNTATAANLLPTPIVGNYNYVLESEYDHVDGAVCKDYSHASFPNGVWRTGTYSPPKTVFTTGNGYSLNWDSQDYCDDATYDLGDHGSVAVWVKKHIIGGGGGGS